jgi:methionyl-tRNA synthetase
MSRQYITTAIDYANAAPHMGHVMEKILADVVARWFRLRGDEVRFQVGMDEHGIKIQQAATKAGVEPQAFVDRNAPLYVDLFGRLGISYDVFIRTTDQKTHWPTVTELWKRLEKAGALEKRTYTGLYCPGCERFLTPKELVDGKCPLHNIVPQEVSEQNWVFLLAREGEWLRKLLTDTNGYRIIPPFRAPETLNLIQQGLEDVSFSRPKTSLGWGIPVPGDPDQVMYVWCDALTNYISGIGLLTDHAEEEWWNEATVTHVIGKDIARFHALIWPAMLKDAGIRTPDQLLIHGFLTSEGQKMSKTIGNVVVPDEVLAHFKGDPDPLRFYLSHEIPVGNDGDFSWKRIDELYDAKLRNQLGNLLNRALVLLRKGSDGSLAIVDHSLAAETKKQWESYVDSMNAFAVQGGVQAAFELCAAGNAYIDVHKLWTLKGEEKITELSALAELLRHVSLQLLPFVPQTAQKIATQLAIPYADAMLDKDFIITEEMREWGGAKDWIRVGEPSILFAPLAK